ncbi:MAG: protein kinase [Blastocatellia bacterium]
MSLIKSEDFLGTNRFLIQNLIGSGTFGVVYQVYDQINNSVVALKKLRKVIYEQNSEALYRFKQEFRSLAEVNHPNLVDLYELISDGNQWFFTMELIDGVSFIDYVYGKNKINTNLTNNSSQQTLIDAVTTTINKSTVSKDIPKIQQVSSTSYASSPTKFAITPDVIERL